MRNFNFFKVVIFLALFTIPMGCKNSKKHKNSSASPEECNEECRRKRREQLQTNPLLSNPATPFELLLGQATSGTVHIQSGQGVPISVTGGSGQFVFGLWEGPGRHLIISSNQLRAEPQLGNGNYEITMLVRDLGQCLSSGGQGCAIAPDASGLFRDQVNVDGRWDKQQPFTVIVSGSQFDSAPPGTDPTQTNTPDGSGSNNPPQTGGLGDFWNNVQTWWQNFWTNIKDRFGKTG